MKTAINVNNPKEVREAGLEALSLALGPVGMVRFLQQYENGLGDYTKEKYERSDFSFEEIDAMLKTSR
jgi:hypothetical protein